MQEKRFHRLNWFPLLFRFTKQETLLRSKCIIRVKTVSWRKNWSKKNVIIKKTQPRTIAITTLQTMDFKIKINSENIKIQWNPEIQFPQAGKIKGFYYHHSYILLCGHKAEGNVGIFVKLAHNLLTSHACDSSINAPILMTFTYYVLF